jgi:hypothetical protein
MTDLYRNELQDRDKKTMHDDQFMHHDDDDDDQSLIFD